jgi:NTP pyrophosphatase (non-canonical NTP hydrolase)
MADDATTVRALRERVAAFVHARDWEPFHVPKELAVAMSVEVSELLERFLWRAPAGPSTLSQDERDGIAEELADVLIYGLSLGNALDLDVSDVILAKLAKDETKYPVDRFRGRARPP